MKNIKLNKRLKIYFLAFIALSTTIGCDKFLDVDTDKDNPTSVALNLILPNIQLTVGEIGAANIYTAEILSVYMHQLVSRSEQDQYGAQADNTQISNDWNNIYLVLTDIQTLINQSTESGDKVYLGIGQALKAYLGSVLVDLWGDVPWSEATQLQGGIISPVFDDQEMIYMEVFDLLDQAKDNISSEEGSVFPGNDDLFYGGSVPKWIKFINTFKLKLYNQIRLSSMFNQSDLDALITEDNFFTSSADDFQWTNTANITPTDERNELFKASYVSAQVDHYLSPWFYEILQGMNPDIHTDNIDPRIPYYWANQLPANTLPSTTDADTGNPRADYWDISTGFFTIRFGSTGPYRDGAVPNDATFPGIYPSGGRYDDGMGFTRSTATNGTGVAPKRILTYYEFLFIQAELTHVGLLSGDTSEKLREAIEASFEKVDKVVEQNGTTQTVPKIADTQEATDFIDTIINEFEAADINKKLEIIMTQKWVASFGDPLDEYTDYRRTGYPVLANPKTSSEYQLNNGDSWPLLDSDTTLGNDFQVSLFWPADEINNNQNAPSQKNPTTYKIFWDN